MLEHVTWQEEPALALGGPAGRAVVVPAWGGKIVSLLNPATGREWLWHNPYLKPRPPVYDGDYASAFDQGGWDECFPAIRGGYFPPGPWEGARIPDHGELWGLPWRVDSAGDTHVALSAACVRFPLRVSRKIALGESGFRLSYKVENPTAFPFPFIWSAHPLLAIEPGMRLEVPDQDLRVYNGGEVTAHRREFGARFAVPETLPGPDAGLAVKCFGRSPAAGRVALRRGTEALQISFDPAEVTHLGLWLNFGGWSGVPGAPAYYNLGLEPCIGAGDDLDLAVTHLREHGTVPAEATLTWKLDVQIAHLQSRQDD